MIAFIDIETGGFSKTNNGLCEVAVVITTAELSVVETHNFLIKPYFKELGFGLEKVSYKEDAMQIHGITLEMLEAEGIPIGDALNQIIDLLVIHNINTLGGHCIDKFDIPWLEYLLDRFTNHTLQYFEVIDTFKIAKQRVIMPGYKLEDLCTSFGIDLQAHRALNDALAAVELLRYLYKIPVHD